MKKTAKRLTYEDLREVARLSFKEAIKQYDYFGFARKVEEGKIEGWLIEIPGMDIVEYVVGESRSTDADPEKAYGVIRISAITGECLSVEILNMERASNK